MPLLLSTILLLLLPLPILAAPWTLNERCEVARETPRGMLAVVPSGNGILLLLPEGLVPDDSRVKVGIGSRSWLAPVVGGAVELPGAVEPFLERNWLTVHLDREYLLGLDLMGTSAAWAVLAECERPPSAGVWETLSGEITASTDDALIAAIRRRAPEGVVLSSPGGLAEEAQRIGRAVRDAGMATKVEEGGECLSECVYVLAAGSPRTVAPGARVGVRPELVTGGLGRLVGEEQTVVSPAVYLRAMGVDGGRLAVLAASARRGDVRTLAPDELAEIGLVDDKDLAVTSGILDPQASASLLDLLWLPVLLMAVTAGVWGVARLSGKA